MLSLVALKENGRGPARGTQDGQQENTNRRRRSASGSSPFEFVNDLGDRETVEIVDVGDDDSYHANKDSLIGLRITVTSPIHMRDGWYCTHATFSSIQSWKRPISIPATVLFGYVRVRRMSQS